MQEPSHVLGGNSFRIFYMATDTFFDVNVIITLLLKSRGCYPSKLYGFLMATAFLLSFLLVGSRRLRCRIWSYFNVK